MSYLTILLLCKQNRIDEQIKQNFMTKRNLGRKGFLSCQYKLTNSRHMVLGNMKKQTGESMESKRVSSMPLCPGGTLSTVNWALPL